MTNRKSHTCFQLVPKSMTLDDLEGPLRTLFQTRASFGAHHENLNEDRPILTATKTILDSDNIRFMRMLAVGGSQDICKFSLDLHMSVSICYTGMVCRTRFQDHIFGL